MLNDFITMDMKTMMAWAYEDLSGSKQVCPDSNKAVISKTGVYQTVYCVTQFNLDMSFL